LHGDKEQRDRERTMQAFRDKRVQMLVCTDVAARGLDVKDVTHVVNYSIPRELDSYVHRIGRTARSGKAGVAMSLVTPANQRLVERIEFMTKSRMTQGKIPSSKDVGIKKVTSLLPKFEAFKNLSRMTELIDKPWLDALELLSKQEIASRFLALLMPDLMKQPERKSFSAPSERPRMTDSRGDRGGRDRGGRGGRGRDFSSRGRSGSSDRRYARN